MLWLISALILALITVFWGIGAYSRLTSLRRTFTQGFAHLDVQIKQRHRAMRALAEKLSRTQTVDNAVLEEINVAHQQASDASERLAANPLSVEAMHALGVADGNFAATLGKLLADATDQASPAIAEFMLQLAEERGSLNNRIAFARQGYNQIVTQYNTALVQFPSTLIAGLFKFKPGLLWQGADVPIERRQEHRTT